MQLENPQSSDTQITPEEIYRSRRKFLLEAGSTFAAGTVGSWILGQSSFAEGTDKGSDLKVTDEKLATTYNNFYEFSLEKTEVHKLVEAWKVGVWPVDVSGLCEKPFKMNVDEMIKKFGVEQRTYRFRCVEAWSMVLPWTGFQLSKLIAAAQPKPEAKYIKFVSFLDTKVQPGAKALGNYPWPYTEALRLDEANHPLTILATGLYGKPLPKQNGAPIRLVVPWKYGFKSIKSIVKIEFVKEPPKTLWSVLGPDEYGFYANVNPTVDHPRWTQSKERVIDGSFFPKRIPTMMFNGYEKEVASLYAGMDLKKNF